MQRRSHWIDMGCACLALIAYLCMISFATSGDWTWGSDSYIHTVEVTPQQAQTEHAQIENRLAHLPTPP